MGTVKLPMVLVLVALMLAGLSIPSGCSFGGRDRGAGESTGEALVDDEHAREGGGSRWAAYDFSSRVPLDAGVMNELKSFTVEVDFTYPIGNSARCLIDGQFAGIENKEVRTVDIDAGQDQPVRATSQCYLLSNHIRFLGRLTEQTPEWADVRVWIPVKGGFDGCYGWPIAAFEFVSSDGQAGSWSYLVDSALLGDDSASSSSYYPYVEGLLPCGIMEALVAVYSLPWYWLACFAEGGTAYLQEGRSTNKGVQYSLSRTTGEAGNHKLEAWLVVAKAESEHPTMRLDMTTVLCSDLPIPISMDAFYREGSIGESCKWELKSLLFQGDTE